MIDETGLLRLQEALLSEVSIPTLTTPSGTVPGGVPFLPDTTKANRDIEWVVDSEWIGDGGEVFMERDFRVIEEIKTKLSGIAPEVLNDMMMVLQEEKTPPAAKVRIYEIVLDRLMGKPEATIRLEDNTEDMEEAERFVEMMAEEIRREMGEEV